VNRLRENQGELIGYVEKAKKLFEVNYFLNIIKKLTDGGEEP
jgi:hypothetical protein